MEDICWIDCDDIDCEDIDCEDIDCEDIDCDEEEKRKKDSIAAHRILLRLIVFSDSVFTPSFPRQWNFPRQHVTQPELDVPP